MPALEPTCAIVGWNVLYSADPVEQHKHIERLEEKARHLGARSVLFCLSEVTAALASSDNNETLSSLLSQEGYRVGIRPTTYFRNSGLYEGLAFASRDEDFSTSITNAVFQETVMQTAYWFAKEHLRKLHRSQQRWIGSLATNNFAVYTTHASYYAPHSLERAKILGHAGGEATGKKLLIGDFNTGLNRKFIKQAESLGWTKLKDPNNKTTFPLRFGPVPIRKLEIDHAFVTPELVGKSHLEITERGPSDHYPLLVLLEG